MPWKSEKQRKWMWANKPDLARQWAAKYNLGGEVEDLLSRGVPPENIEMAFKRNGFNIGGAIARGFERGFNIGPQIRDAVAARQAEWRNAGLAGGLNALGRGADANTARAGAAGLRTNRLGSWGAGGYNPGSFMSKSMPDTRFGSQGQAIGASLQEQGNAAVNAAQDVNKIRQQDDEDLGVSPRYARVKKEKKKDTGEANANES